MPKETYCKLLYNWGAARGKEASTWRGIILAGAALVAAVNPAAGVAVAKVAAALVGAIDIFTNESKGQ